MNLIDVFVSGGDGGASKNKLIVVDLHILLINTTGK